MGEVDEAFIQALEHRAEPVVVEAKEIPIIDLSLISSLDFISNDNVKMLEIISEVVKKVGEACEKWGFFQVINHGVPKEKMERFEKNAREFFGLSLEEKRKISRDECNPMGYYDTELTQNVRDWKEVFDFTTTDLAVNPYLHSEFEANRWPTYPHEFREAAEDYAKEVEKLGFKLMELISLSLGLPANRLDDYFKNPATIVRVNHYPPCPTPGLALGVGRHKDPGALAILAQDDVGGLQVRRKSDGEWVNVKPTPEAFIINIGDVVQVWSNDKYESVEHRAMVNSQKERLSIPFFFNPAHQVLVKPLDELVDENNPAKYNGFTWGEFIASRRMGNFKNLKVKNIQISHFKLSRDERTIIVDQ